MYDPQKHQGEKSSPQYKYQLGVNLSLDNDGKESQIKELSSSEQLPIEEATCKSSIAQLGTSRLRMLLLLMSGTQTNSFASPLDTCLNFVYIFKRERRSLRDKTNFIFPALSSKMSNLLTCVACPRLWGKNQKNWIAN